MSQSSVLDSVASNSRPCSGLQSAVQVVYLREPRGLRDGPPSAAQGRDLHAALLLSSHLAEAGVVIRDSLILEPAPKALLQHPLPVGSLADYDFSQTDLVVQTTRPCLDDCEGHRRKPRYDSFHAIERAINQSLRPLFQWLDREQVSLNPALPLPDGCEWLGKLAFGLYHKRPDGLAEATRWTAEGKEARLAGTTFGYLIALRRLEGIERPFLGLFGMSREDTFRMATSLQRFPGLIRRFLHAGESRLGMIRITRPLPTLRTAMSVQHAQDFDAELVVDMAISDDLG